MCFVTQLSKMINVKLGFGTILFHPQVDGSSDKIPYFLFSPVSFLISTDPVMSKFVPVTPTQSRPQGFFLKKWVGRPTHSHPVFKGKALGTSLTPTVVINMFPIDVYYSQDILKT